MTSARTPPAVATSILHLSSAAKLARAPAALSCYPVQKHSMSANFWHLHYQLFNEIKRFCRSKMENNSKHWNQHNSNVQQPLVNTKSPVLLIIQRKGIALTKSTNNQVISLTQPWRYTEGPIFPRLPTRLPNVTLLNARVTSTLSLLTLPRKGIASTKSIDNQVISLTHPWRYIEGTNIFKIPHPVAKCKSWGEGKNELGSQDMNVRRRDEKLVEEKVKRKWDIKSDTINKFMKNPHMTCWSASQTSN